jgi:hypothetical protein
MVGVVAHGKQGCGTNKVDWGTTVKVKLKVFQTIAAICANFCNSARQSNHSSRRLPKVPRRGDI